MRISEWSAYVCSSDLYGVMRSAAQAAQHPGVLVMGGDPARQHVGGRHVLGLLGDVAPGLQRRCDRGMALHPVLDHKSEKRRGGKECVSTVKSRWSASHSNTKI